CAGCRVVSSTDAARPAQSQLHPPPRTAGPARSGPATPDAGGGTQSHYQPPAKGPGRCQPQTFLRRQRCTGGDCTSYLACLARWTRGSSYAGKAGPWEAAHKARGVRTRPEGQTAGASSVPADPVVGPSRLSG